METKEIVKKAVNFLSVCVLGMLIAGCASMKVQAEWMNPSFQKEEHSVLIVDKTLHLTSFDGSIPSSLSYLMQNGKQWVIFLAPGVHAFTANYGKSSTSSFGGVVTNYNGECGWFKHGS